MPLPSLTLPDGRAVPLLGQGMWNIGDSARTRASEIATVRRGIDLGMTMIDTAEMYGEGDSEDLVGEAIEGRRDAVFLVSKVYPHNASRKGTMAACEASLGRLGTDYLDLYLLHWRGGVPLSETVEAFQRLMEAGKIRAWGVSNFDCRDMEELWEVGGQGCATNQVLYNPTRRGIEYDLLPWMAERGLPLMAYSPIEQGRLPKAGEVDAIARKHGASIAQVFLAFVIRSGQVIAIPKASTVAHVEDNARAASLTLDAEDLAILDRLYPPPTRKQRLAML